MKRKAKATRKRQRGAGVTRPRLTLRVTDEEHKLLEQAATPYPLATWARVELIRIAREKLGRKGA